MFAIAWWERIVAAAICPSLILVLVLICFLVVHLPGRNQTDDQALRKYAQKYLKAHPAADEDEVREVLREWFLPDAPDPPRPLPYWIWGVGILAAVALGRWLRGQRYKVECRRIDARIDQVVEELFRAP